MSNIKNLVSIDPGMSTGVVVGTYSDEEPFRVTYAGQIQGGVENFIQEVRLFKGEYAESGTLYLGPDFGYGVELWDEGEWDCEKGYEGHRDLGHVICEKFSARGSGNGFSYRTEALEPLRVEGAILAIGLTPEWVQPPQQYFMGGKSKAAKMKARNAWLKDHKDLGYYITGKDVGCADANDARSALSHAIAWLRRNGHRPTQELFR